MSDNQSSELQRLGARIDELESRLMFQDVTIETLNQTVTGQWHQIDVLTRQVASLTERLREAEAAIPRPASEPPPHY